MNFGHPQSDAIRKTGDFHPQFPPPPRTSFKDDHITINGYFVYLQALSAEQKSNAFF